MKDDIVVLPRLQEYDINDQVVFDKVLLMGTDKLSLVGRPYVGSCKVYGTVQEQTLSEKKITFKMRAKKGIKKTKNKKVWMTVLRIDKIEFIPSEELLERAVAL